MFVPLLLKFNDVAACLVLIIELLVAYKKGDSSLETQKNCIELGTAAVNK